MSSDTNGGSNAVQQGQVSDLQQYLENSFQAQFAGAMVTGDEQPVLPGVKVLPPEDFLLLRGDVVAATLRLCLTPAHDCQTDEGRQLVATAMCEAWNASAIRQQLGLYPWAFVPAGKRIPDGWKWNEATVEVGDPWYNILGSIIAMDISGRAKLAGTGFVIDTNGDSAIMCTAAHVLLAVRDAQHAEQGRFAAVPAPLRPPPPPPLLDRERLRVSLIRGKSAFAAIVTAAVWDRSRDIAFLRLAPQDPDTRGLFPNKVNLSGRMPDVGEEISILSLDALEVVHQLIDGDHREIQTTQRLALRSGYVTAQNPERSLLCPCPSVNTTIPVTDGMSGGAAFFVGADGQPLTAFGFVSTGAPVPRAEILDRSVAGDSIIAIFPAEPAANGTTAIRMREAESVVFQ